VPKWEREQKFWRDEEGRQAMGAEPRDTSEVTAWRKSTDEVVLEALDLYGSRLIGQTNGFSDALSLPALVAALDLEGVEQKDRPEMADMILRIHTRAMEIWKVEQESRKHG